MRPPALFVLLAVLTATHAASADGGDARRRARERFRAAEAAYAKGAYAAAAEEFERADMLVPHPATAMNAADAWERAGEPDRTAEIADRISATAEGPPRLAAAALLSRVSGSVSTIEVLGSPALRVRIGDREVVPPRRVRLKPGTYVVIVRSEGDAVHREHLVLDAGVARTFDAGAPPARPAPAPAPPPPPPARVPDPPASRGVPALAWVSFALAAGGVGTFGWFGTRTLAAQRDYEADPTVARRDAFYTNRTIANVALASAGVFATVGVVLVVTSRPAERATGAASIRRVALVPGAGGAALTEEF